MRKRRPSALDLDSSPKWLSQAVIVQPWGDEADEHLFIRQPARHIAALKRYAINTLTLIPTEAHNHMSSGGLRDDASRPAPPPALSDPETARRLYTDEQFKTAVRAYQRSGIRVMLYSCLAHVGHHPDWNHLFRAHPEWLARDINGNPYGMHGGHWFCPNHDDAFAFCAGYTCDLVKRYAPDAILLDNNFFPLRCYCPACEAKFARELGHPQVPAIPRERRCVEYERWINWRYRSVETWTLKLKGLLRAANPRVALVTNTFWNYNGWTYADEDQCAVADANLTECYCAPLKIGINVRLAQAFSHGRRRAFCFLCTWMSEGGLELRAPAPVRAALAATLGHGASPWLVNYGRWVTDPSTPTAQWIRDYLQFHRRRLNCYAGAASAARVALCHSRETADHCADPVLSRAYGQWFSCNLQWFTDRHIPFDIAYSGHLPLSLLRRYRLVVLPHPVCIGSRTLARLLDYIRRGGTVLFTENPGTHDELGQLRKTPALQRFFKQDLLRRELPEYAARIGHGRLLYRPVDPAASYGASFREPNAGAALETLVDKLRARIVRAVNCPTAVEIVPTIAKANNRRRLVLHLINNEATGVFRNLRLSMQVPPALRIKQVRLESPDRRQSLRLPAKTENGLVSFTVPELAFYAMAILE